MKFNYTVGIKSRFFPFFRKFQGVTSHVIETAGNGAYLVITFASGEVRTIGNIANRDMRVYSDYALQKELESSRRREVEEMAQNLATQKIANIQQAAMAAQQRRMATVPQAQTMGQGAVGG